MSYNLHVESNLIDVSMDRTAATQLLDAILSGQSYANKGKFYMPTYANSNTLRAQFVALLENRNMNYLKLVAFALTGFLQQLPDADNDDAPDKKWYDLAKSHANKNFTVDELIAIEDDLVSELSEVCFYSDYKIGNYHPLTLADVLFVVKSLRREFATNPTLANVSFDLQ